MHEMSLARALCAQVLEITARHGNRPVRRVVIQLGELSGFEPALVASAFGSMRGDDLLSHAQMEIRDAPLEARCLECGALFRPTRFRFICPACGSRQTEATAGEGVVLESIELEEDLEDSRP